MLFIGGELDGHRQDLRSDLYAVERCDTDFRELYDDCDLDDLSSSRYIRTEICGVEVMLLSGMDDEDAMLRLVEHYLA